MSPIQAGAVIYAKDYLRLADFYKNVANLKACDNDNTFVRLESGAFQLVILQTPKRIAEAIEISVPPVRREDTPIKLVFFVDSLDKARELATKFGGELNSSEKEWEFGTYTVCDGHDPEGNVFQLRAPRRS
jgi:predicted enzyme related to lactoylglutathione lyase